jgi:predicted transcriptional regulator
MGRNLPVTSLAASKAASSEMRAEHYQKIVKALTGLKQANYEKISEACGLDRHQVGRRMKELEGMGLVYKPGLQSATSSGRKAFNYSLTNQPELTPIEVVDALIKNATKPNLQQGKFF